MSLNQAISEPIIYTIDEIDYTFEKITPNIWVEFCGWLNRVNGRKVNTIVDLEEMLSSAQSALGLRWLLWRSLRVSRPSVTAEEVGNLIPFRLMTEILTAIMDLPEPTEEDNADPPQEAESV
jgi:hypothetical protein